MTVKEFINQLLEENENNINKELKFAINPYDSGIWEHDCPCYIEIFDSVLSPYIVFTQQRQKYDEDKHISDYLKSEDEINISLNSKNGKIILTNNKGEVLRVLTPKKKIKDKKQYVLNRLFEVL